MCVCIPKNKENILFLLRQVLEQVIEIENRFKFDLGTIELAVYFYSISPEPIVSKLNDLWKCFILWNWSFYSYNLLFYSPKNQLLILMICLFVILCVTIFNYSHYLAHNNHRVTYIAISQTLLTYLQPQVQRKAFRSLTFMVELISFLSLARLSIKSHVFCDIKSSLELLALPSLSTQVSSTAFLNFCQRCCMFGLAFESGATSFDRRVCEKAARCSVDSSLTILYLTEGHFWLLSTFLTLMRRQQFHKMFDKSLSINQY